ncbi:MAG: hypothetical protein K8Q88_07345 [Nitrosarchaeum sp.]|nr:hypothetical protein [Nitrosarchaeum sp.]
MKSVLLSIIPIICIMVFVTITENDAVPSFTQYNEYFRIVNMVSIGYIVFRTLSNTDIKNRKILFLIPLGFITLFSSQFVRFLFTIEPETLTLLFSGILKIIALTIILFALTRDSKKKENKELRDG